MVDNSPSILTEAKAPGALAIFALLMHRLEHWATDLPSIELLANWVAVASGIISFVWVAWQIVDTIKKRHTRKKRSTE